jgi:glutamate-1-semialdehyde aminotransferase
LFHLHPSGVLEQPGNIEYFRQHPALESICATCPDVTCVCPAGIDIPRSLTSLHAPMMALMRDGLIAPPDSHKRAIHGDGAFGARIVSVDLPKTMKAGQVYRCRLQVENAGERGWLPHHPEHQARVALGIFINRAQTQTLEVTQDVHREGRWRWLFEITPPRYGRSFRVDLRLLGQHQQFSARLAPTLVSEEIRIERPPWSGLAPWSTLRKHLGISKAAIPSRTPNRPGAEVERTSTAPARYAVEWQEHNLPSSFRKGEPCQLYMRVTNRGSYLWPTNHPEGRWVEVVVYFGTTLHRTARIPHDVAPGASVLLTIPVTFPSEAEHGKWTVTVSFVEQQVAWFHECGMKPLTIEVLAEEPDAGVLANAGAIAARSNGGMWLPSGGIRRSRTGLRYPTFIEHATGCRIRDPDGHEWIDWVMAGGAALLGYAHPEVQTAVARQLSSSAVVTLAHMLELTVTGMLCDMIPCAEMVLFGKHGSDMCTAAIRTARLYTGRRKVLYSGYHGWHDWFAETLQPKLKDPAEASTLFRFDLNDVSSFETLVAAHRGEIAAVILEPAAQASSLDDPPGAADPAFLRRVAEICRTQGCVLIFDEIVTGFRYPQGSVQRATGVVPDLACLGKALSGGMPLAALVGRRDIMQASLYAGYVPTFRGEVYSLAAAAAALQIHQREQVPARIDAIGRALQQAVNQLSRELDVAGSLIGVPFRMIYKFDEPDAQRRVLMRTLLQQELLQRGILTYKGFMLPSLAHGAPEIEQTVSAFRVALMRVQQVVSDDSFVQHLEIPLF